MKLAKHRTGWQVTRLSDGAIQWTSPTRRILTVPVPTYPVDHTIVVGNDNTDQAADPIAC